jgi:DNA-binding CsgD family transcriptional regulator
MAQLTKREKDILSLLDEGKSNREIALNLFVSPRTVHFHLANIFDKMGAKNRVHALRRAIELGLITL